MDINQLKYFKTVAEAGKISVAAKLLFVTPSAISASILALEKELGVKLFDHWQNRLRLNRQGRIFLQYADHILESVADARGDLMESLGEEEKTVVVGATSIGVFPDLFAGFVKAHPEIKLTSSTVPLRHINSAGLNLRFSFLFAAETEPPAEYTSRCQSLALFEDGPCLMVHPEHPWAKRDCLELRELSGKALIWPRTNWGLKTVLLKEFSSLRLPPPVFGYHHYETAKALVQNNSGAVLTTLHNQNSLNRPFVFVPIRSSCRWKQLILWRGDQKLTEEDTVFLDFVKKEYNL